MATLPKRLADKLSHAGPLQSDIRQAQKFFVEWDNFFAIIKDRVPQIDAVLNTDPNAMRLPYKLTWLEVTESITIEKVPAIAAIATHGLLLRSDDDSGQRGTMIHVCEIAPHGRMPLIAPVTTRFDFSIVPDIIEREHSGGEEFRGIEEFYDVGTLHFSPRRPIGQCWHQRACPSLTTRLVSNSYGSVRSRVLGIVRTTAFLSSFCSD